MKHLKSYNVLFESGQVFDYEVAKPQILSYIRLIKDGKEPFSSVIMIYSIIRGESKIDTANKLGFTNEQKEKWKESLKTSPFRSDGVWSQIDYNPHLKSSIRNQSGKDITYNYYVSIIRNKENIIRFGSSLNGLNQRLHNLSYEKNSPISFKTHTLLDLMCGDNDSLKVFYYELRLKDDIENTVKDWITSNGIYVSERTHYHGVDYRKEGEDKKSWGIIISSIVEENFRKTIIQNGNKYTDEQYFEWFKNWLPNQIRNISINYG